MMQRSNYPSCRWSCDFSWIAVKKVARGADTLSVTEDHRAPEESGAQREFSTVRKGYDPAEVEKCLAEYDDAFRDLEEYATRLKRELEEARLEIGRLRAAEQESVDNAMLAVFDAKDRIIQAAMERAQQIEDQARASAGVQPQQPQPEPPPEIEDPDPVGEALLAELSAAVGQEADGSVEPNDVLQRMLNEAEAIRTRLDSGLAAAFDQMEQMQRDAETRAEDLLMAARLEAGRLRAAGNHPTDPAIQVTLTDDESERPSRYTRNSAGLPRIGEDEDGSVLAKMNILRAHMHDDDDDEPDPNPVGQRDAVS